MAIDAANLYWTEEITGTVKTAPLAGGSPTTLATGQSLPSGVAVNPTAVFWVDAMDGTIMKVAK
jgi:hypothetical protein